MTFYDFRSKIIALVCRRGVTRNNSFRASYVLEREPDTFHVHFKYGLLRNRWIEFRSMTTVMRTKKLQNLEGWAWQFLEDTLQGRVTVKFWTSIFKSGSLPNMWRSLVEFSALTSKNGA